MSKVVILVALLMGGVQTAQGDCMTEGGYDAEVWLDVYWDAGYSGDQLSYDTLLTSGGEYELALAVLGDTSHWNDQISSIECEDGYPTHWWLYQNYECSDLLEEGDGTTDQVNDNDQAGSLRFRCADDDSRTWLTFCEDSGGGGKTQQIALYKRGASNEVVWYVSNLSNGYWNDKISSIETGVNWSGEKHAHWYFYKHSNFNNDGAPDLILTDSDQRSDVTSLQISSFRLVISDNETPPVLHSAMTPAPAMNTWGAIVVVALLLAAGSLILVRQWNTEMRP